MGIKRLKQLKEYSLNHNPEDLHDEITPAEVRVGENVHASIKYNFDGTVRKEKLRVWRLSPLGIELVKSNDTPNFEFGEKLDIKVSIGNQTSEIKGVFVASSYQYKNFEIIGIRLVPKTEKQVQFVEKRAGKRWWTSNEFMPTGTFPNPGRFNDFVYFTVVDISSQGMKIRTSLRNKFLVKGMKIQSTVSFPMVSTSPIHFEIVSVDTQLLDGQSYILFGCKILNYKELKSVLGDYIFQFGPPTSIEELKQEGLSINSTLSSVDFNFARTEEEYTEAINLRKLAYSMEGKCNPKEDNFTDIYDSRSRIIIAKYRGKVIASCRIIFNEFGDEPEHKQFIDWPKNFPRIDEFVEITRVCTHPEYRKADLLMGLFKFAAKTVVQSGRRYVIGCATEKLLPLYTKLGFKDTGIRFNHKDLNNSEHKIISADIYKIANGIGVNPIVWNIVWSDLVEHLINSRSLNPADISKTRIGYYKLFKPFSQFVLRKAKKKKK